MSYSRVPEERTHRNKITIYTDGSCNPTHKIGGWAAILFIDDQKVILKGMDVNTTHQRMELMATLKALEYLKQNRLLIHPIFIYSDSQYVISIQKRRHAFKVNNFRSGKGNLIRNDDLVRALIQYLESAIINFTKVVAHQKITGAENFNRQVDMLARSIVRKHFK